MKSEKLTNYLRRCIISEMKSHICDRNEVCRLGEILSKTYEEMFYKEYFKSQEDTEYYLKNRSLFKNFYKRFTAEDFGIEIKDDRYGYFNIGFTLNLPSICDFSKKDFDLNLIKNQKSYEGFRNLFKKYIYLFIENETCCDKYYTVPQGNIRYYYYHDENFCKSCSTTKQLQEQFPEVYKYYLEVRKRYPASISPETKIENLRKELGYLTKIKNKKE